MSGLFSITNAAITPGTHPQSHKRNTIRIEPQPLSNTANGGKKIESKTLHILIIKILIDELIVWRQLYYFVTRVFGEFKLFANSF